MDALRKAEEQKRMLSGQGAVTQNQSASQGLDLEPISSQAATAAEQARSQESEGLPDLSAKIDALDDQFIAHAQQSATATRPASSAPVRPPMPGRSGAEPRSNHVLPETQQPAADSREAARNLFEVKQQTPPTVRKYFVIIVGFVSALVAIGIGGYFWWQLQPKSSLMAVGAVPAAAPAPPAPVNAVPPASTFQPPASVELPPKPIAQVARDPDDEPEPAVTQSPPKRVVTAVSPAPAAIAQEPSLPIRVGKAPRKLDPALDLAYQAFNRGDFGAARNAWLKVLASDPHNPDALHGLATVSLRQNQPEDAAEYYRRALEADPKDALALAGLLSMRAPVDAMQMESRLKILLSEQPESPYLHFALGNLYARGKRWAEAQAAFFKAYAADPDNPDYLFNLAVSLDQLHQPRLALQYYNQALEAAKHHAASFDAAQVTARVAILQSNR